MSTPAHAQYSLMPVTPTLTAAEIRWSNTPKIKPRKDK
jgi:hypothetical protein